MRRSVVLALALVACQKTTDDSSKTPAKDPSADKKPGSAAMPGSGTASPVPQGRPKQEPINPPMDVKAPPADAVKTTSGLAYKILKPNPGGVPAKRNDTVVINYTGWKTNGETFYSTKRLGQPTQLNLSATAAGFTEALQLLKKGESAIMWMPPTIGYKTPPPAGTEPETLVYEIEVVDIVSAPDIPRDVAAPPAAAKATKSGTKYITLKPGAGEKARNFDTVTFHYTAWEGDGRQFDSTEVRKRPAVVPPYRQPAVMEEILVTMAAGERVRFWTDASKMLQGKQVPGMPTGTLCYELEVESIAKAPAAPPPVPKEVAAPPADAQKTEKGVSYKVLRPGKGGDKPKATDHVRVHYTGWTTDGRMFDSSIVRNEPAEFNLGQLIPGWTDGMQVMTAGEQARFWIPEELAYKGAPGRPAGMLVFDVELVEIKPPPKEEAPPMPGAIPAPPDVAAPPADAKKTEKGVSYKVLSLGGGGPKPTPSNRVKVHYTGWQTDGKMFDSSVSRGTPAEFSLGGVIAGWTDGLQVMSIGDKVRFWIPEELAYKGSPGRPQGMLVFDVELLEIK
ncbi:MAG: FKBP-type peptidyl-prolyl cis-trans isomerase [Deltaproteobacteria bacterium]|nr:FKBP-type peptidyl-prolyl cis-trans isomerase [Deltaproteobacteria bacterium]